MQYQKLLLMCLGLLWAAGLSAQPNPTFGKGQGRQYLLKLDDAQLDVGLRLTSVFALDDRAPLSANPHFQAMWNLVRLGASLESILQGTNEPLNDINMNKEFGKNGYNKTVLCFFARYSFGESSDVKLQRQFFELVLGPGYFRQGRGGMHLHLDYGYNIALTNYGAGVRSIDRAIDYEIFLGARIGFDWSFQRSENESGFFAHLNSEIRRIADENEFTASQLIMLGDLLESSRILLPESVGGRAFHIGPTLGVRFSKGIMANTRLFASATGFYDAMDLAKGRSGQENRRSQHSVLAMLGLSFTIGGEGRGVVSSFF
jgi:hypothetical protein